MQVCPICETKADESQVYCLVCAWEFEYYFDKLEKEAREMYESRFRVYRSIYDKSILSPKIIYKEKIVYKEKLVPQEKIVYRDRIVEKEKIVPQEKIIYRDRVVEKEKKGFFSKLFGGDTPPKNQEVVENVRQLETPTKIKTSTHQNIVEIDGLMYQNQKFTKRYTWEEAKKYAKNLRLGGYDDWRLPTIEELHKLLTISKKKGINGEFNIKKKFVNNLEYYAWFWTSSKSSNYYSLVWVIVFSQGSQIQYPVTNRINVLCVRG